MASKQADPFILKGLVFCSAVLCSRAQGDRLWQLGELASCLSGRTAPFNPTLQLQQQRYAGERAQVAEQLPPGRRTDTCLDLFAWHPPALIEAHDTSAASWKAHRHFTETGVSICLLGTFQQ
eukprot:1159179-Pelagomonas_calceolata.AAC.5